MKGSDEVMKPADMRAMSDEQLGLTLKDQIKHLFQLRVQSATERLETPSEIKKAKRDIARIKTIQTQRSQKAAAAAAAAATKGAAK
jgi:large subunit ribosomal protein L29